MHRVVTSVLASTILLIAGAFLVVTATGCGSGGGGTPPPPPPAPTVGSVAPAAGFQTGGTAVTISGTDFTGATDVTIGGATATSMVIVNDTTITCTTAASAASGAVPVVVTNAGGPGSNPTGFTYVSFPPTADPLGDYQIDTDASTWPGLTPVVACTGGNLYVAWIEDRGLQFHVYFNRSTDGGTTWAAADTEVSQAPSVPGNGLRMSADGNNIYLCWVDTTGGTTHVRMNASADGGLTWRLADVVVSQTPASLQQTFWQSMCCSGSTATIVWPSTTNFFAQRTTDGGSTWLPADVPVTAGGTINGVCEICCTGSAVHAVWADTRNGDPDIFYSRSADGGATWNVDVRIDTEPGILPAQDPEICCDASGVHVAWRDARNGGLEVRANSSNDGGASWGAADQRVSLFALGTQTAEAIGLCCEGSTVHVTWQDARNGNLEPFYNRSTDGGATYGAGDVRLNKGVAVAGSAIFGPPLDDSHQPNSQICCDQGTVHVCWTDFRSAAVLDVFLIASADGGATWPASDVRMDTDLPLPGNTVNGPVGLCCNGPIVYAVWRDDRNNFASGEGDIAFQRTVP